MLTLITGPDAYLVRTEIARIQQQHDPTGLSTTVIDARPGNLEEIRAAVGTPGFFGAGRVVIVHDLLGKSVKSAASEDEEGEAAESPGAIDWPRLFSAIQPENVVIFADRSVRTVPAAVKKVLPPDASVYSGEPPRGPELLTWMQTMAKRAGTTFAGKSATVLAEKLAPGGWAQKASNPAYDRPPDLELFASEIDKLALYAYPDPIDTHHIAQMSVASQADQLFPLIDAVIGGNSNTAVNLLNQAIMSGDEPSRITIQLSQQGELMAAMASGGRREPAEIGRDLGLSNPNRMHAIGKSLQAFGVNPRYALRAAITAERQLKTGVFRQPVDQLYALVEQLVALGAKRREGGT